MDVEVSLVSMDKTVEDVVASSDFGAEVTVSANFGFFERLGPGTGSSADDDDGLTEDSTFFFFLFLVVVLKKKFRECFMNIGCFYEFVILKSVIRPPNHLK